MLRAVLLSGLQGQQTLPGLSKVILDFEGLARNPISFHNHICQAGLLKLLLRTGGATDAWLAAAGSACSQPPWAASGHLCRTLAGLCPAPLLECGALSTTGAAARGEPCGGAGRPKGIALRSPELSAILRAKNESSYLHDYPGAKSVNLSQVTQPSADMLSILQSWAHHRSCC